MDIPRESRQLIDEKATATFFQSIIILGWSDPCWISRWSVCLNCCEDVFVAGEDDGILFHRWDMFQEGRSILSPNISGT